MGPRLTDEQRKIVEENIGIAKKCASDYYKYLRMYRIDYDDAVSICCIGMMLGIHKMDVSKSKPSTYLYATAKRELFHAFKRSQTKKRSAFRSVSLDEILEPTDPDRIGWNPEELIVKDDSFLNDLSNRELVEAVKDNLSERQLIVAERIANGDTLKSIADDYSITYQAIYSIMKKATEKLKRRIDVAAYGW